VAGAEVETGAAVLLAGGLEGVGVAFEAVADTVHALAHAGAVGYTCSSLAGATHPKMVAYALSPSRITLTVRAAVVRAGTN
jgi:hypothetical protein